MVKNNKSAIWFILILVVLFFLSKQSGSKQVDVTYNYYDESGNLLGSGRESTVNGIPGVYYVRVVTNVKNTGTVPLRNIGVSSASPAAVASAYSGVADVATLGAGATTTLTSGLINITQFEGSTVPVSIVIDSQYTTGDGINSTVTYTGNTNLVVTPDTTPITGKIYYVSMSTGSDSNTGLTESTPIKSISKINTLSLQPGDKVLFKRGDIWREGLNYNGQSGDMSAPITFGAYGAGNKPRFYGSINGDSTSFWTSLGNNRWSSPAIFPLETFQIFYNTNTEPRMGSRRTSDSALTTNWDFMWISNKIIIYNTANPATVGNGIELPEYDAFYQTLIWFDKKNYIVFNDIEISYTRYRGLGDNLGNFNQFKNIDFKYGYEKAFWVGGNNAVVNGNTFYLCGIRGQPIPYGLDAQGENIWITQNYNVTITNNKIERCGGVCINFYHSDKGIASHNEITDCDHSPTDWSAGIYYDGCSNYETSYNLVKDCQVGYNIGAENTGTSSHDMNLHHNIAVGNAISEMLVDSRANPSANINIHHNTFYKNDYVTGSGYGYEIFLKNYNNIVFKDNIIYNDYTNTGVGQLLISTGTNLVSNNNLWYSVIGRTHFSYNSAYYTTLANFKGGASQDANSQNINPNFDTNYKPTGIACTMSSTGSYVGAVPC